MGRNTLPLFGTPASQRFNAELEETSARLAAEGAPEAIKKAFEIVRARWGWRYPEMTNEGARKKARLRRRQANGGTDGQSFRYDHLIDGMPTNENGKSIAGVGMSRSQRRHHRVDSG